MEISLIRIRFPLFAHIIARSFAKVQTANRYLRNALAAQLDPVTISVVGYNLTIFKLNGFEITFHQLTLRGEMASCFYRFDFARL